MYACPVCETSVQDFELSCPRCSADLALLARLNEFPDAQFNRALQAARQGDLTSATLLLSSLLQIRCNDADAWALLGTVYARRGFRAGARECWQTARMLQPTNRAAKRGLDALARLEQAARNSTPPDKGT